MKALSDGVVSLRPMTDDDIKHMREWDSRAEIDQPFNFFSDAPSKDRAGELDRGGFTPGQQERLMVSLAEGTLIGDVSWHAVVYGPNMRSTAYNIGIGLVPAHRGKGYGSRAQRLLATHLFATTEVHRVEASTDVTNVAEQRALEKAGFVREGMLRGAQYRAAAFRDLVLYSRLRTD